jgi:molybdopterin-guanine dinucleotide biosynthesis protein A
LRKNAIILTDGAAGAGKALLLVGGVPLIRRQSLALSPFFDDVLISCKSPETYEFLGLTLVKDESEGEEAMAGLLSSLKATDAELNFCISCDLPIIHMDLIRYMLRLAERAPSAAPESEHGPEPLYAVYRKECAEAIGAMAAKGEYSLREMLRRLGAATVSRREVKAICGRMNALYRLETPPNLRELESLLEGENQ